MEDVTREVSAEIGVNIDSLDDDMNYILPLFRCNNMTIAD
jgi:hypothetical protein